MKVTKSVGHTIRMGQYESLHIGTTVEVELTGGGSTEEALDQIDQLITDALEPDIKAARRLAVEDSYIQDWGSN